MLDGEWHAVPCRAEGFEGVSATRWLDTMADLPRRFAGEAEMTKDVVMDALAAIKRIAAEAEKRAGISVEPLGRERLDRAEKELLGGFAVPLDDGPDDEHVGEDPLAGGIAVGGANADPSRHGPPDDDDGAYGVEIEGLE